MVVDRGQHGGATSPPPWRHQIETSSFAFLARTPRFAAWNSNQPSSMTAGLVFPSRRSIRRALRRPIRPWRASARGEGSLAIAEISALSDCRHPRGSERYGQEGKQMAGLKFLAASRFSRRIE